MKGVSGEVNIKTFDILGKEILSEELRHTPTMSLSFDLSEKDKGAYFLKVSSEGQQIVKKIISD